MTTLDEQIRAIVRDELRRLGAVVRTYTSTELPPGISSREHFASECRRLRIGRKDGRAWTVDADAWHAARARTKRGASRALTPTPKTAVERADELLERSGLRLVK